MPTYSRSITIDATPDELFQYLSDVENLPKYFHRLTEAHPATGDEVHVAAEVPGQGRVESDAEFHIDADNRSLRWGTDNDHDYHGELQVTPAEEGATVEVTLHTEHESDAIGDGIDETLQNVAELVADHPKLQS